MEIWTMGYNPWVMGGSCHYVCVTELDVAGPVDLGKGYTGYVAYSPGGYCCVVESTSKGIVGHDIEEVRQDIADGDDEVMRKQVEDATKTFQTMRHERVDPAEFWKRMKKA